MRYSFNTLNHSVIFGFPPSLPEQIRLAAEAGYDFVGLDIASVAAHAADGVPARDIAAAMDRHGIGCFELAALPVPADRAQCERGVATVAEMATELRPELVYAIIEEVPSPPVVDNLRYVADTLGAAGVRLGLEWVVGWGVDSLPAARDVVSKSERDIGIVFDTWQWLHGHDPLDDVRSLDPAQIAMLQIADVGPSSGEDLWHDMSHTREMPGRGSGADLTGVCRAVFATGFDGTVSVEVLSSAWRTAPLDEFVSTSLATARDVCTRAAAGRGTDR
jgi:sugar phosphate isomerase/epimerase